MKNETKLINGIKVLEQQISDISEYEDTDSRKAKYTIMQLQQENRKYKEVIDRIEKYIEKETRIYGLSMSIELGTHFDNILGILKEVE